MRSDGNGTVRRQRGLAFGLLLALGYSVIAAPFDSPGDTKDKSSGLIESLSVRGDDGAPAAYGRQLARVAEAIEARTPYPPGMSDDFDWATYPPRWRSGRGNERLDPDADRVPRWLSLA